jgi:LuxR family transcriptional regulator, quorum-sensing system regulator BjaR1
MAISLDQTYEIIEKLNRAVTPQEICEGLTSFTSRYGLTSMMACTIPSRHNRTRDAQSQHLLVPTFPRDWMERYLDQGYVHVDPVIHRIECDLSPFLWSESAPFAQGERSALVQRMFGEAGEFGLKAGFAVPMITIEGAIAAVSLGGKSTDLPPAARGMIAMISTFAIARAIDLRDREHKRKRAKLTRREIECLKWAADGKTEWEISAILNVSEHTADKHLANAHRKLGAANRAQAVANAIRWGLIT